MTSSADELNDKQGKKIKKKSQNGCANNLGSNNVRSHLNQRQEFHLILTSSKAPLKFNKNQKKIKNNSRSYNFMKGMKIYEITMPIVIKKSVSTG